MADEEEEAWTVVGRNNRPRRPANDHPPSRPGPAPAGAGAVAAAAPPPADPLPRLPGWGARRPSKRPSADPPAAAAAQHKRPHLEQQQQQHQADEQRPGRRREREAAGQRGRRRGPTEGGGGGDGDEGGDRSLERRHALHVRLVREAAAEVSRSGMFQSLRAAMASAGEDGEDGEDGKDSGEAGAEAGRAGRRRRPGDGGGGGRGAGFPWASVSELVVYGLGSVESSRVSRHQAALATLLASPDLLPRVAERAAEVAAAAAAATAAAEAAASAAAAAAEGGGAAAAGGAGEAGDETLADSDEGANGPPITLGGGGGGLLAYDPCFSRADRRALASLGAGVLGADERCRRRAARPAAFFYLPHLEAPLTDALLGANWTRGRLRRTAVLANAFSRCAERWSSAPGASAATAAGASSAPPSLCPAPRLLALVRAGVVREWPVREDRYPVASAFNDAALHTFCGASDAAWEAAGVPEGDEDGDE